MRALDFHLVANSRQWSPGHQVARSPVVASGRQRERMEHAQTIGALCGGRLAKATGVRSPPPSAGRGQRAIQ